MKPYEPNRFLSLAASAAAAAMAIGSAQAIIVIDGSLDGDYGSAKAVQTVQTGFGDNADPNGFGDGGELNAGYAVIQNGRLNVMLTGNIQNNFNKVSVFIDSVAGGENQLNGALAYDFGDTAQNFGGLTFDAGFEADYHLFGRWGGGAFELDIIDRASSSPGAELGNTGAATVGSGTGIQTGAIVAGGSVTTGADGGGFLSADVPFGFNNTNTAGVAGGTAAADQGAAAAVTTGLEFSIDLGDLGSPGIGDVIKIHAVYGNGDNNFHSNQVLSGLAGGTGNLGGDGAGGFTGGLSGIDFNNFTGDQFFTVTVPEPSTALLGFFGLGLLARRRR